MSDVFYVEIKNSHRKVKRHKKIVSHDTGKHCTYDTVRQALWWIHAIFNIIVTFYSTETLQLYAFYILTMPIYIQ